MKKNKDMNEEELKAQQEETLDNVATSQQDEGDKAEEQPAKEMSVEDKLAAAETKVAELQDKYLRQVAEFDNYRKRTIKEKAELILNGAEKTITAILPILDDMERRLRCGLPGYLILFAPHAFAPQRQLSSRKSPSPPV